MNYYKVTAPKGEGDQIVPHLGIFQPGETRHFSQDEIDQYVAMNGVPLEGEPLPKGFKIERGTKKAATEEAEEREEAAVTEQEENAAALLKQAQKEGN